MSMRGLLEKLVKPPYEPVKLRGWMIVLMLVFFSLCSLYAVRIWDSTAGLYVFFISGMTLLVLMGLTIWEIMKSALKSLPQGIEWSRNSIESAWNRSKETMRRIAIWILAYLFVILLGEGLRWRDQTILAMVVLATICLLLLPTIWPKKKTERVEKEEIGKEEIGKEEPHSRY